MKWQEMLCGKGTFARLRAVVQSWMQSSVMNLWVRWGGKQKSVLSYIISTQDIPLEENDMWKHIRQVHNIVTQSRPNVMRKNTAVMFNDNDLFWWSVRGCCDTEVFTHSK